MKFAQLAQLAAREVTAVRDRLPEDIRTLAATVPVHFEPVPPAHLLEEGFEPDILGLFSGTALGDELAEAQPMPAQIFLYLENLWDYAEGDRRAFADEVRVTYLHELGHYLGWDEDELEKRGLE